MPCSGRTKAEFFGNIVLRRTFATDRGEVRNAEANTVTKNFKNFYPYANIIKMIKIKMISMCGIINACNILSEKRRENNISVT